MLSKVVLSIAAFAALALADDTSSMTTSSLGPRESLVTVVETSYELVTSTNVDSSVYTTSLPKSLFTRTTQVAADTTLVPVLTPSVISANSTYVITSTGTDSSGKTTVNTVTTTQTAGQTAGGAGQGSSGMSTGTGAAGAGASSTSKAGAYQTMIPGAVGLVALGVAALL